MTSDATHHEQATGGLLRSSVVVAAGTALSRLTGLARIVALAYALGTSLTADAYNLANNTPNIVYDLVLGGVLAATLVPLIVERMRAGDREAVDVVATTVTLAAVLLTAVGLALSPLIVRLYTFDLPPERAQEQLELAVPLLLMFMPQVLFYGLTTLWTALLNSNGSFAAPAFAPVLNNLVVVAVFLALPRLVDGPVTTDALLADPWLLGLVGFGTTAGIVAMTMVLVPAMRRAGVRTRWRTDRRHPVLARLARMSGWTLAYVVTNQVLLIVLLALMNRTGDGAVSAYTYAWLFFQLPYGLIAVSVMTTFTPELARHAGDGALGRMAERFGLGLRAITAVLLPTVAAYVVLATPILTVLLERGAFGQASVDETRVALVWLAVALPGYAVFLYSMRGFYAFTDTRTPFVLNLVKSVLTFALAVPLAARFGLAGVLGAYAAAYGVGAVLSMLVLRARLGGLGGRGVATEVARHALAAGVLVAVLVGVGAGVRAVVDAGEFGEAMVELTAALVVGAVVYLAALWALRSEDLRFLRQRTRLRSSRLP